MRLHIDSKAFATKPSGKEIGGVKSRMKRAIVDVSIKEIAEAIKSGQTLQPAVTPFSEASKAAGKKGTVDSDFESQTVFMIDIDNEAEGPMETIENADSLLTMFDVEPAIIYETFSSTAEHPKFRILIVCDEEITDRQERDTIIQGLLAGFAQADKTCINADRIFFGTDKGLAVYRPEATVQKKWLIGLAEAFRSTTELENCDIIPVGHREQAMFDEATRLITRFGDTPKAKDLYEKFLTRLEVVPGESDPPQAKANYVFDRCRKHFHEVTEKDPGYIKAEDFDAKYRYLAKVYRSEHEYLIGVQSLAKGGYGNDLLYEYTDGVWKARSEEEVKRQLARRVQREGKIPDPTQIEKAYKVIMTTGRSINVELFNSNEDLVCFKNGVYRLSDGAVLEHDPKYHFTIQLDARIPETPDPTPYCDLCLQNFGGPEIQNLLLQIFGAAISNVYIPRFKKGVLMYGPGNSGKTQFKGLAERILGARNFNNVDLSDLENNRFLSSAFQFVRLGGSNDMSNVKVKEQKIFKMLTGGDNIQAEHKGQDSFSFKFKGILWFLANQLPLFGGDKGNHVYERWIVIPCNNSVPEEKRIKDLQDRMFEERDSFCIKALRAFQKAVANNYTFDIPEECRQAIEEYKTENSSVRTFIEECCEPLNLEAATKDQTTGKMWRAFKDWCENGKYYIPTKAEFKRELAQLANVNEANLVTHIETGNFYPYVLNPESLKAYELFSDVRIGD